MGANAFQSRDLPYFEVERLAQKGCGMEKAVIDHDVVMARAQVVGSFGNVSGDVSCVDRYQMHSPRLGDG